MPASFDDDTALCGGAGRRGIGHRADADEQQLPCEVGGAFDLEPCSRAADRDRYPCAITRSSDNRARGGPAVPERIEFEGDAIGIVVVGAIVAGADFAATRQAQEVYDGLAERVDRQVKQLQEIIDTDVANFNGVLRRAEVSPVEPLPAGAQ